MSKSQAGPPSPVHNIRPNLPNNDSSKASFASTSRQTVKDDMRQLDPDEIFTKHSVPEVKSILYKLRSDVDAKQEELRLMVGERYRDLLDASTSIISMSESSKRVVNTLDRMKVIVSMDRSVGPARRSNINKTNDDAMLHALQCLAAHLKLLLDTPEHLWRFLERKRYLHAAWLFLLARVVHRSLIDEGSDESRIWVNYGIHVEEKFPLVQRQWESVSQFRTQISHKSTLSLREHAISSKDFCASLLALHLLDSLPLSDAMDLFLKQRTRALHAAHETINSTQSKSFSAHASTGNSERIPKDEVRFVKDVIESVLDMILNTVSVGREAFGRMDGSRSMIERVLAFSQDGGKSQPAHLIPEELRLTTESFLASLPNSNHFTPLPSDIKSFKPFVDSDSSASVVSQSNLDQKLQAWFSTSLQHLQHVVGSCFLRLDSVKEVWEVRTSSQNWLSQSNALLSPQEGESLSSFIDGLCESRVEDLWKNALINLLATFTKHLRKELQELVDSTQAIGMDVSPTSFLLSAPPISSVSQASLGASIAHSSFQRFKRGIKLRLDGMTPSIDSLVSELESNSSSLRNDLDNAFSDQNHRDLKQRFIPHVEKTAEELFSSLEDILGEDTDETARPVRRLVFLGRLVLKLSSSSILTTLHCSEQFIDHCRNRTQRLHEKSVEVCASEAAKMANEKFLESLFSAQTSSRDASGPSSYLMNALLFLIQSAESHGCFNDQDQRSAIVKVYLRSFSSATVAALNPRGATNQQLIWDVHFFKAICESWVPDLAACCEELENCVNSLSEKHVERGAHLSSAADVQADVSRCIPRVQLLLLPLLIPPETLSLKSSGPKPTGESTRVKTNGGSTAIDQDPLLPLQLVKPSARFGSLWIGTAKSQ